jgi:hypothetical protein
MCVAERTRDSSELHLKTGVDETAIGALQGDGGLPRFVRALVGLDREAVKRAFSGFLEGRRLAGIPRPCYRSSHGARRHGPETAL